MRMHGHGRSASSLFSLEFLWSHPPTRRLRMEFFFLVVHVFCRVYAPCHACPSLVWSVIDYGKCWLYSEVYVWWDDLTFWTLPSSKVNTRSCGIIMYRSFCIGITTNANVASTISPVLKVLGSVRMYLFHIHCQWVILYLFLLSSHAPYPSFGSLDCF